MPSQSKSLPFFSTIHFNIRSLSANHDGLTMLLSDLQHSFDVIGFSETKIKSNCDLTSNIAIEGYDCVSKPTLANAGGVGFFIKGGIQCHIWYDLRQRQKSLNLYWLRLIGPKLWNELHERFKCRTATQFKKELTSHFICLY